MTYDNKNMGPMCRMMIRLNAMLPVSLDVPLIA